MGKGRSSSFAFAPLKQGPVLYRAADPRRICAALCGVALQPRRVMSDPSSSFTASGLNVNVNPMTLHSYENYASYRCSFPSRHRPLSNPDHITFHTLHIYPHPHNSPFSVTQQPQLYANALNCPVENSEQPNVEWPVPVSSDTGASSDDPELESEPDESRTPFPQFRIRWRR